MPAGQATPAEPEATVSAWMSLAPWCASLVACACTLLPSSSAGSPDAKPECGCCVWPQLNKHALNEKETRERCRALTCLHSYGSSDGASSELCAAHGPRLCAGPRFREKFVVRGCASSGAAIFEHCCHEGASRGFR